MPRDNDPKLCLSCARRKLARQPEEPCAACLRLNVDPMAQVRSNFAKPSPLDRFSFASPGLIQRVWPAEKPARPRPSGRGGMA